MGPSRELEHGPREKEKNKIKQRLDDESEPLGVGTGAVAGPDFIGSPAAK